MTETVAVPSWDLFGARVAHTEHVGAGLVRFRFAGHNLDVFADYGFDQRVKLIVPARGTELLAAQEQLDWSVVAERGLVSAIRQLPEPVQPAVRTYTVRGVSDGFVDIDIVLHGTDGPASAWATGVLAGDPDCSRDIAILGPRADFDGDPGGIEFVPGAHDDLLLVGDETALPAIASILERLPGECVGTVLVEVAPGESRYELTAPPGVQVHWIERRDGYGVALVAAAERWRPRQFVAGSTPAEPVDEPANWDETAWDVPEADATGTLAWVAGEASAVRAIRRHLVGPCGLPKSRVAFMGYWRQGRAES